jgi:site-specific DNA recombinase
VSGGKPFSSRKHGAELLAHVRPGDNVVVVKLDRTFRDAIDGLDMIMKWSSKEISLHVADSGTVADTSTSSGFMNVGIHLLMAHVERMQIGERTSAVLQSKKSRGERVSRKDRIPFGMMLDPDDDKMLLPEPEEQATLELIRTWLGIGLTYVDMCEQLNSEQRLNRGKEWTRHTVRNAAKWAKQAA